MKKCPRSDCDLDLLEDEFYPPGAFRCPKHGGPIWDGEDLVLETEVIGSPYQLTEFEVFTNMLSRLCRQGLLNYSTSQDMSGFANVVATIENHGSESIDVRFEFDCIDGKMLKVNCYTDRRE